MDKIGYHFLHIVEHVYIYITHHGNYNMVIII